MKRFVLWDLDGTLVDSGTDIVNAANAARESLGMPPLPFDTVRGFVGEGAAKLMRLTVGEDAPAELHARALETFLTHYRERLVPHTLPYPGIDALVRKLAGRQSVTTNKPGDMARRIVQHFDWMPLFVSVLGADDVPHRKPAPDMIHQALKRAGARRANAILVGDTVIDIEAAEAAGIDMVAVRWGLRPNEDLSRAPRVVETAEELAQLLGVE